MTWRRLGRSSSNTTRKFGGIIVEPIQRLIPPQPGFLQGLRNLADEYEIPLIFDEVVTGFRFAYGGAQEFYGVKPDLCTLGKAVAGGFPLTAIAGSDEIMSHMDSEAVSADNFMPQIGTLSGNPIAAAAGLKTLEILRRPGTYEGMRATGNHLRTTLQKMLDEAEIPCEGNRRRRPVRCVLHRSGDRQPQGHTHVRRSNHEQVQRRSG